MALAIGRPEKQSYLLVTFAYGDPSGPTFARYTNRQRNSIGFTSIPTMEVELAENTGSLDKKETRITMPSSASFAVQATARFPHSPIYVVIEEVVAGTFAGDAGSRKHLFVGRVIRTVRSKKGTSHQFRCLPAKSRLEIQMGLPATHHCVYNLFRAGCTRPGLTEIAHRKLGQIATINGPVVTISTPNTNLTAPTSPGGNVDRFWERGFLRRDGLLIPIRMWELSDPTVFYLRDTPPNDWLLAGSASITFVPGCHKTEFDCIEVWDNENNHGAFGTAIPPYNPIFETPQ